MKWFENYCTLPALYSFYKNYHDMHANGDITLKYETNTENLTKEQVRSVHDYYYEEIKSLN